MITGRTALGRGLHVAAWSMALLSALYGVRQMRRAEAANSAPGSSSMRVVHVAGGAARTSFIVSEVSPPYKDGLPAWDFRVDGPGGAAPTQIRLHVEQALGLPSGLMDDRVLRFPDIPVKWIHLKLEPVEQVAPGQLMTGDIKSRLYFADTLRVTAQFDDGPVTTLGTVANPFNVTAYSQGSAKSLPSLELRGHVPDYKNSTHQSFPVVAEGVAEFPLVKATDGGGRSTAALTVIFE